jgi:hypothetical protein
MLFRSHFYLNIIFTPFVVKNLSYLIDQNIIIIRYNYDENGIPIKVLYPFIDAFYLSGRSH